ncbi:acyl carrier protein [Metamycoplasma faucium]|jgi:acyl carrier protein, putative|uniref:Acyl carrier protein n=1 Tax=Metamycoplasma faucium TaxID=56142 RepID=A0ABZ2TPE8_9BACT
MNKEEIIFKELKKYTKKEFTKESYIKELNIDSLDLLMLVTELEKTCKITISDEELLNLKTIDDIIKVINSKEIKK